MKYRIMKVDAATNIELFKKGKYNIGLCSITLGSYHKIRRPLVKLKPLKLKKQISLIDNPRKDTLENVCIKNSVQYKEDFLKLTKVKNFLNNSLGSKNKIDIKSILTKQRRRPHIEIELDSTLSIKPLMNNSPKKHKIVLNKRNTKSKSEVKITKTKVTIHRLKKRIRLGNRTRLNQTNKSFNKDINKWSDKFIRPKEYLWSDQFLKELVNNVLSQTQEECFSNNNEVTALM